MSLSNSDREWLLASLTMLREEQRNSFAQVNDRLAEQNGRVRKGEIAVAVIQQARRDESAAAIKRGTWAGLLAAAGLSGLLEVLRYYARVR